MKELRIKIGFVNGQKPTEEEKEILRGTMTVLAKQFEHPERFVRTIDGLKAIKIVPYKEELER